MKMYLYKYFSIVRFSIILKFILNCFHAVPSKNNHADMISSEA